MKILLTNDDGINAEGLSNLYNLLSNFGETIIVAPEYNQSTKSHSISLNTPLRVKEVEKNKFALTGLPADCVNFAINSKIGRKAFDLVVGGIAIPTGVAPFETNIGRQFVIGLLFVIHSHPQSIIEYFYPSLRDFFSSPLISWYLLLLKYLLFLL